MALIEQEATSLSELTRQEEKASAVQGGEGVVSTQDAVVKEDSNANSTTSPAPVAASVSAEKSAATTPEPQPSSQITRPSLVPLGSAHSSTTHKKFSAVNIGKKFLEKNAQAAASTSSSNAAATKSNSGPTRPVVQTAISHSRLVTAKLTAAPIASSTAGWSRPSSVTPSAAGNDSRNSTSPIPTSAPTTNATSAAPHLPHVGKVIHPQPRAAVGQLHALAKETSSSGKPVWGSVKPPSVAPLLPQDDFPTVVEVANSTLGGGKKIKVEETKSEAVKQARLEEADTFRGVHLDPNAHHWDEMEEDDDDFLGGVVEFGDGRQYKVEATEADAKSNEGPPTGVGVQDRFVDDFDRSWPRSGASPASSSREFPPPSSAHEPLHSPTVSSSGLHPSSSPRDSSRVLFNERSNKLEPYNHFRQGQPPFSGKRPGFQDGPGPEHRSPREFGGQNIQVLHKAPGGDFGARNRRFSGASNASSAMSPNLHDHQHLPRRDGPPPSPRMGRDGLHLMGPSTSFGGRERDAKRNVMGPPPVPSHALKVAHDSGRQLPPHLTQLPPGASPRPDVRSSPTLMPSRVPSLPSHSPRSLNTPLSAISPILSHATIIPFGPGADVEEVRKEVMQTAAERARQRRQQEEAEREAQKDRARRKASEIEERMKAEEAAKAKALEASKPAPSHPQDEAVISVIEEAVQSVKITVSSSIQKEQVSVQDSARSISSKGVPRPRSDSAATAPKRPPIFPTKAAPSASQTDSWRSKAHPVPSSAPPPSAPPPPAQQAPPPPRKPSSGFAGPNLTLLDAAVESKKEDLEVIDFSDMAMLVDGSSSAASKPPKSSPGERDPVVARAARPVASDFFEDTAPAPAPSSETSKPAESGWRRKDLSIGKDALSPTPSEKQDTIAVQDDVASQSPKVDVPPTPTQAEGPVAEQQPSPHQVPTSTKEVLVHAEHVNGRHTVNLPPQSSTQRTPRRETFYKEVAISSLDDTMSRIKRTITDMKAEVPKEPSPPATAEARTPAAPISPLKSTKRERWVPPPLRPRTVGFADEENHEVFSMTAEEPPSSPPPSGSPAVRFPKQSRFVEMVNRRQLTLFNKPAYAARFELLSFVPPVEGMNKRDFSLNDVLFRKPTYLKGRIKYRVFLPRAKASPSRFQPPLSASKLNGVGAFGRPTIADGASSWRKPASAPAAKVEDSAPEASIDVGLDTMSGSPPPDTLPSDSVAPSAEPSTPSTPKPEPQSVIRPRAQPKMPAGSSVAVRRDSRIDVIEADVKSSVNFIVTDELEEVVQVDIIETVDPKLVSDPLLGVPSAPPVTSKPASDPPLNVPSAPPTATSYPAETSAPLPRPALHAFNGTKTSADDSLLSFKSDIKFSENSTERSLLNSTTHQPSPWARSSVSLPLKESTSRGPDPEHLKAVWSQTADKSELHPVNSLEGIADDLTSLPFTLQDVKSEDGETPPPIVPQPPSRMSLHDVTRAFQQVPQSSSSSATLPRPNISPPSTNAPVARPSTAYSYSPLAPNNMRPPYASYPSPLMSHSPTPTMMYAHPHPMTASPVPARMQVNAHTPLYGQSMWVPMPGASPQNGPPLMRASTYPAQLMHYAHSGIPQSPYSPQAGLPPQPPPPPNMLVNQSAQNANQANRGRTHPVMSPVMSHAQAMYPPNPMMMHAPAMQMQQQQQQNHGYAPAQNGRGPPRADGGVGGGHMGPPQTHTPAQQQPPHIMYTPAPSSSFARSGW